MQAFYCKITRIVKRYIPVLFLCNCQHSFIYRVFLLPSPRSIPTPTNTNIVGSTQSRIAEFSSPAFLKEKFEVYITACYGASGYSCYLIFIAHSCHT